MNGTSPYQTQPTPGRTSTWIWVVVVIAALVLLTVAYYYYSYSLPGGGVEVKPGAADDVSALERDLKSFSADDLGSELSDIEKEL